MAEQEQDDADRTEEPTERRLSEARKRGKVMQSREVSTFLLIGSAGLLAATMAPYLARQTTLGMRRFLADAHEPHIAPGVSDPLILTGLLGTAWPVLVILAILMVAALAGPVLQGAVVWSAEPLAPKLERISPLAGAKRLFSLDSLIELAKSLAKVLLVGGAAGMVLWAWREEIMGLGAIPPRHLPEALHAVLVPVLLAAAIACAVIAGLDWAHQRAKYMRQMRMTRRDIKDELKQTDGDPFVKQRLRGLRMERARRRMMAEVPKSTVVVTNPTHVAVALKYDADMAAPIVTAKGYDEIAQAIKALAREHRVPVVENPPLARALAATVEPGKAISVQHYQAVAEIIAYVVRLGHRRSP
jgi:flagellar biosynthesis protein FlhB